MPKIKSPRLVGSSAVVRRRLHELSGRLHELGQKVQANSCVINDRDRWNAARDIGRDIQGEAASILEIVFGHSGWVKPPNKKALRPEASNG